MSGREEEKAIILLESLLEGGADPNHEDNAIFEKVSF